MPNPHPSLEALATGGDDGAPMFPMPPGPIAYPSERHKLRTLALCRIADQLATMNVHLENIFSALEQD